MTMLDHVVVNALRNMDSAVQCFAALGFTLTPRGYHTLGSINHLMMTRGAYLELVGVPEEGLQRQEVLDSPYGLNGLVFRSDNADADYVRLKEAGLPAQPVGAFSRPVEIKGKMLDARFRTVRFPLDTFSGGRVYFCEHLTPELVWRDEWLLHPNGFRLIERFVIESPTAEADARRYAAACASTLELSSSGWVVPLDDAEIRIVDGTKAHFVTVELVFDNLDDIARRAALLESVVWEWISPSREATLALPDLALNLTCRSNQ
ncbi:MAG: VOC family protein [Xanthobacteraceae bacterium]|nr:VOC family protein [Xanthobacteraceae bacterium]